MQQSSSGRDIMHNKIYKTILWVTVFAIAMAYMETAVVVYMRALYYPEGFDFPLKQIDKYIALTEFFREVATMFMLIGIGVIAGRKNIERFAFFIYSFAVWDIFYYVFLKLLLGWPASFLTWDILFMIPVAWVGPVICPVINSFTMILLALLIIFFVEVKGNAEIGAISWILLITGSLIIILSYTLDYTQFMLGKMSLLDLLSFKNSEEVIKYTSEYKPAYFNWYIFNAGEIMHLAAIMLFYYKNRFKL